MPSPQRYIFVKSSQFYLIVHFVLNFEGEEEKDFWINVEEEREKAKQKKGTSLKCLVIVAVLGS